MADLLDLGLLVQGNPRTAVAALAADSRQVEPGALFFAVPGFRVDGHEFIEAAVARGAAAVVAERAVSVPKTVAVLQVPRVRPAMGQIAARWHGHPSRHLRTIGITGTNGKTTVSYLTRAMLTAAGRRVGLLGTVANYIGDEKLPVQHTTPDAVELQDLLARMVRGGCDTAVMEVSSHALVLERVAAVEYDVAALTNLTPEHLDFHGDLSAYAAAKGKLFSLLGDHATKPGPRTAVLNADDPAAADFKALIRVPLVTYGLRTADFTARQIDVQPGGTGFTLVTPAGTVPVQTALRGLFNVYNTLAAAAIAQSEGASLGAIQAALAAFDGVPGRMEAVAAGQPFTVLIDYAHTPDGLENVLAAVREFTRGRLILVFGCGGDRDRVKRPAMGRLAARLADITIITSDNPRSEEPAAIIDEIYAGFRMENALGGAKCRLEPDRAAAIEAAVRLARAGDTVLIAGKGHESVQIFRTVTKPFDERAVVLAALRRRQAVEAKEQ